MTDPVANLLLGGPAHGQVWATEGRQTVITVVLPPVLSYSMDGADSARIPPRREGYYRVRRCAEWIGLIDVRQPRVAFGGTEAWWEWWVGAWQGEWQPEPPHTQPEDYRIEEYLLAMRLLQLLIPRRDNLFEPPPACTELTLCTQEVTSVRKRPDLWSTDWDDFYRRRAEMARRGMV